MAVVSILNRSADLSAGGQDVSAGAAGMSAAMGDVPADAGEGLAGVGGWRGDFVRGGRGHGGRRPILVGPLWVGSFLGKGHSMPADRDYLPAREAEFSLWVQNYLLKMDALAVTLGLTAADVAELDVAVTTWTLRYGEFRAGRDATRAAQLSKNTAKVALKAMVRRQVKRLQASPAITDARRAELGVTVPSPVRSPVAPPPETPSLRLYFGDRGRIRLRYGPNPDNENANGLPGGVYGVVIECAEGGMPTSEAGWSHLATRPAGPYVHAVETATPKAFAYRCRYVNRKGEAGPWSAAMVGTVTP